MQSAMHTRACSRIALAYRTRSERSDGGADDDDDDNDNDDYDNDLV